MIYFSIFLLFQTKHKKNIALLENDNKQKKNLLPDKTEDPRTVAIKNALTKINATEWTWLPSIQFDTLKI